jgi:hypothetical protein
MEGIRFFLKKTINYEPEIRLSLQYTVQILIKLGEGTTLGRKVQRDMMVSRDLPHKQEGYANEDAAFT